ncbi:MAG: Clp protease N-terminal domain-containing protein [Actinocrinis sp.]
MFEKFTPEARQTIVAALDEARLRGDRRIGTEHVLLGLLRQPAGSRILGTDLQAARSALDGLDRSALAAIGIDVKDIDRPPVPASRKRTPFTSGARAVIPRAVAEMKKTTSHGITLAHLLLAVLACEPPDPAADLIAQLGIDRAVVRERVMTTT